MQQECLDRILQRVIVVLEQKGLIEKVRINGHDVQVTYKSPLVVAQGEQDVAGFMKYYQVLQAVQGPEAALVNLNPVKFPAWTAEKLGVDPTIINDSEHMEEFYRTQSEKAQEMEMQQMMQGAATAGQQPSPQQV